MGVALPSGFRAKSVWTLVISGAHSLEPGSTGTPVVTLDAYGAHLTR